MFIVSTQTFLLVAVVFLFHWRETTAACTQARINQCVETGQICQDQICVDSCPEGYIEFRKNCILIEDLTVQDFRDEFKPSYGTGRSIGDEALLQRLRQAAQFISTVNRNQSRFQLGLTPFSADGEEDYVTRSGFLPDIPLDASAEKLPPPDYVVDTRTTLPPSLDWRSLGAVTSVKDQGRCGCCWAVAMAGAIEGSAAANALANGTEYLQNMSWQQFISCNDFNSGCNGGNMKIALGYAWLNAFDGVTRDNEYPYSDYDGDTTEECTLNDGNKPLAVTVDGPKIVLDFDPNPPVDFDTRVLLMKEALQVAPVAMTIKSSCNTLSNYRSGIMDDDGGCACSDVSCIDHAVLMVGYDDTTDPPSWILKNSWGSRWGEDGYFRISQREKGDYGLFGVVSHGVQVEMAQNVTGQVDDNYSEPIKAYAWVLIALAILCGGLCGLAIMMMCRRRYQKEDA